MSNAQAQVTQGTSKTQVYASKAEVFEALRKGSITDAEADAALERLMGAQNKAQTRMGFAVTRFEAGQSRGREGFELGEARVDLAIGRIDAEGKFVSPPKGRHVITLTPAEWALVLTDAVRDAVKARC